MSRVRAALGVVIVALSVLVAVRTVEGQTERAVVSLQPSSLNVALGAGEFTVDVVVRGAAEVGAFEFQLRFDPKVIAYVDVARGPFIDTAGGQVHCARYVTPERDRVQFGCGTLSGATPIPGASGDGTLATVRFKPVDVGTTDLLFTRLALVRPDVCFRSCEGDSADDIPVLANDGVVRVYDPSAGNPQTVPPTPVPDSRRLTPTPVAGATATPFLSIAGGARSSGDPWAETAGSERRGTDAREGVSPAQATGAVSPDGSRGSAAVEAQEGFPVSGYGMQHRTSDPGPPSVAAALGGAGVVLLMAAWGAKAARPRRM